MPITDAKAKSAKPAAKPYKLTDGKGMYLEVQPSGGKYWRLAYRFAGKQKKLALGVYPDVSLSLARDRRDDARRLLVAGTDPGAAKQAAKRQQVLLVANSFKAIATEWLAQQSAAWVAGNTKRQNRLFDRDIFPWIGSTPIAELTVPDLLAMARRIEARGALDTAHRAIGKCGEVCRFAVATGRATRDPSRDLSGALPARHRVKHFAAITDPKRAGDLLRLIDGYRGTFVVRCALQLAPLTFVRPGELRLARWADIDLDAAEWRFTASKTDTAHIVPLSTQAIGILRELQALTGRGLLVFPGARGFVRPMSENTITSALRYMGIAKEEMSGHGFRAMARTLLHERLDFAPDWIEAQLAHTVPDRLGGAYNRSTHLDGRRRMMQSWADYLDRLRTGADVIELGAARSGAIRHRTPSPGHANGGMGKRR